MNGTGKIFEEVTSGFKELIFERLYGGNDTDGIKIKVFLKIAVKSTWWWLLCGRTILPWLVLLRLFAFNLVILGVDEKEIACQPQIWDKDKTVIEMTKKSLPHCLSL